MTTTTVIADSIRDAFCAAMRGRLNVARGGSGWVIDTPHILQDGRLLQVFVSERDRKWAVSDGGWAAQAATMATRSDRALANKLRAFKDIAGSLDLSVSKDGRIGFEADDLATVAARTAVLALAVDRALSVVAAHAQGAPAAGRQALMGELSDRGVRVAPRQRVRLNNDGSVQVDVLATGSAGVAAIEYLSGNRPENATVSVDRAIVNLIQLDRGWQGRLFAVYDEASYAADAKLRSRFASAAPSKARLLPLASAAGEIAKALAIA